MYAARYAVGEGFIFWVLDADGLPPSFRSVGMQMGLMTRHNRAYDRALFFRHSNSSSRRPGAVHPLLGWTGFLGNSETECLGLHVFQALLWPVRTIERLSTGLLPPFLSRSGESRQQVPSTLPSGIGFDPCSLEPGSEPEREGCLASTTRTVSRSNWLTVAASRILTFPRYIISH